MKIAVIGAGASGLAAALQAAWNDANVTLFERNDSVGRKLTVTGSGHCNLTNDAVSPAAYTCANKEWMHSLLTKFGVQELLSMLAEIGIPARRTHDGWYYPLSNSAHSVVEAFSSAVECAGVRILTGRRVTGIHASGSDNFTLRFLQGEKEQEAGYDRLVVSTGGCAYPSLGSRGEMFPVLQKLGHTVLPNRPALAPMLVNTGILKSLQGMRFDVETVLWNGNSQITGTRGNLIFTEWGLNGPAVMDISHHVSLYPAGVLELSIDFLAYFQQEFDRLLNVKRKSDMPSRVFLDAFFPPKAGSAFLRAAGIPETLALSQIDNYDLDHLTEILHNSRFPVKGVRDFAYCQVSAGGVPVSEVDPFSLESKKIKGLFLTGETLDVVGPCGGYNLQFAFSSGALAGMSASVQSG